MAAVACRSVRWAPRVQMLGGLVEADGSLGIADAVGRLDAPEELADRLSGQLRSLGQGESRHVVYA
jgi:hypothetical protein